MASLCCNASEFMGSEGSTNVILHIYDLNADANKALRLLGTGAFHSAVEVAGLEWSYGYSEQGSGIFSCEPKCCAGAKYRESVKMGHTPMSPREVDALLERMRNEWRGMEYDLLRKNCCVFSNAFCVELGVGPIPSWVTNLAAAGATLGDGILKAANVTSTAAIIAAAKAGEINSKYKITGTAQAKAKDFIAAVQGLDHQYQILHKAEGMAAQVVTQAGQLDRQYGITAKAQGVAANVTEAVQSLARQSVAASQAASQASSSSKPPGRGQQASNNAEQNKDCVVS